MELKKLIDNPIWDAGHECVVCGSPFVQHHHIFPGSSRKASDRYGYIIPLCPAHHTGSAGIHHNRGLSLQWMRTAQKHFERHRGTREDFRKAFGKSYLLEEEE